MRSDERRGISGPALVTALSMRWGWTEPGQDRQDGLGHSASRAGVSDVD